MLENKNISTYELNKLNLCARGEMGKMYNILEHY